MKNQFNQDSLMVLVIKNDSEFQMRKLIAVSLVRTGYAGQTFCFSDLLSYLNPWASKVLTHKMVI